MARKGSRDINLFLFAFLASLATISAQGVQKNDIEHKLLADLFTNYSKDARPVLNKSEAVEVKFDLAYAQLINLNSKDQVLQSKVWLRQMWINPFLTWDPDKYAGIMFINVDPKLIWRPDIILYNNLGFGQTGGIDNFDTKATLNFNGYTQWFAPTEIHSICKIDITFFPFDEQFCTLKFGSWTYTESQLNFTKKRDTADLAEYTVSGEWDLVNTPAIRHAVKYSCCADLFIDITYTIHIRRKVLFYMTNLIVPCIVLAMLTVFSFHLPPESGERMGLVITILLGLTVFMLVFTENVPRTSEVTPLIGKYAFTVLCIVAMALLITCCILRVYHKDPDRNIPVFFRKLIFDLLGPMLLMKPPVEESSALEAEKGRTMMNLTKARGTPYDMHNLGHYPPLDLDKLAVRLEPPQTNLPNGTVFHTSLASNMSQDVTEEKLEEIAHYAHTIVDHIKEMKTTEGKVAEWRYAAAVLDCFFFWVTLIIILASTLAFYFMIPF